VIAKSHGNVALVAALAFLALFAFFTAHPRASRGDSSQQGSVGIEVSSDVVVPGQRVDVGYRTSPGTLQQNVDIYFSMKPPDGPLVFLRRGQGFSEDPVPLRSNVEIGTTTRTLFRFSPVRRAFGTYTYSVVLLYAGKNFGDEDALASEPASGGFTFDALSERQRALIAERGNPDLLTVTWIAVLKQKQEVWFYYSDEPTQYDFLNGDLTSESALTGSLGGAAPALDPSLLTPQTTLEGLTAVFGTPSDVTRFADGAPGYQGVTFSAGLQVVFRNRRLTFAETFVP
jgi:hypothetical protein